MRSSQFHTLLAFINTVNEDIQFNCEKEESNFIGFLDTRITKATEGILHFGVYRNSSSIYCYLDYNSNNPTSHKYNSAKALQRTAYSKCTEEENKAEALNRVRYDLLNDGHPGGFIDKFERKITKPRDHQGDSEKIR